MFDITALGEILIDFTDQGKNEDGIRLFAQNPGGAPANMLSCASRLGASCAFIGKAGNDMHGQFLRDTLIKEHIDAGDLILDNDCFTTLAFVSISDDGERSFSFARKPGADTRLREDEVDENTIISSQILHVGSLSLTDEPARSATLKAVDIAKKNDVLVSYDPNYRASLWPDREEAIKQMRSITAFADLMKISDEEAGLLTDHEDPKQAAEELIRSGVRICAVTLGKGGAYICSKAGGGIVPGFETTAADTTGAGDSFWGAFLYKISRSGKRPEELSFTELTEFTAFANAAASLCVGRRGGIPSMPVLGEVEERLRSMQR